MCGQHDVEIVEFVTAHSVWCSVFTVNQFMFSTTCVKYIQAGWKKSCSESDSNKIGFINKHFFAAVSTERYRAIGTSLPLNFEWVLYPFCTDTYLSLHVSLWK